MVMLDLFREHGAWAYSLRERVESLDVGLSLLIDSLATAPVYAGLSLVASSSPILYDSAALSTRLFRFDGTRQRRVGSRMEYRDASLELVIQVSPGLWGAASAVKASPRKIYLAVYDVSPPLSPVLASFFAEEDLDEQEDIPVLSHGM